MKVVRRSYGRVHHCLSSEGALLMLVDRKEHVVGAGVVDLSAAFNSIKTLSASLESAC